MQEGDSAIDFELSSSDGTIIKLSSFKGNQNTVLCFYPKNHLFACPTKKVFEMANSVISVYSQILESNSVLFAISIDTVDSQMKFVKDYSVPYLHLSDTEKNVCKTYAGLNIAGLARRSTFVTDKQGIVRIIFRDIDVKQHGRQIVESLKKINQEN